MTLAIRLRTYTYNTYTSTFPQPFSTACLSTSVLPTRTAVSVPKQEDGTKSDTRKRGQKKQPKLERRLKPRTSPNNLCSQYNSNSLLLPLLLSSLDTTSNIRMDLHNSPLVIRTSRSKLTVVLNNFIRIMLELRSK